MMKKSERDKKSFAFFVLFRLFGLADDYFVFCIGIVASDAPDACSAKERRKNPFRMIFDAVIGDERAAFALADDADKRRVRSRKGFRVRIVRRPLRIVFAAGINVREQNADLIADVLRQVVRRGQQSVVVFLDAAGKSLNFIDRDELPFTVFAERVNRRRFAQNLPFFRALRQTFEQVVNRIRQFRSAIESNVLTNRFGNFFAAPDRFEFFFALNFLLNARRDGKQSDGKKRHHRHQ